MRYLQLKPRLMPHQLPFVMDDTTPIQGFVGGYRSGKSFAGTWKSIRCAVELFPGENGVMMAPIAGMNQTNIVPILREILPKTGLDYDHDRLMSERCYRLDIKVGGKTSSIYLDVSAENAKRMVGRSLAWGYFDESDVCRNGDLAYEAFTQLKARCSEAENPIIFATSTPEGYSFMHRKFVEENTVEWIMEHFGVSESDALAMQKQTKITHVQMTDNFLLPKNYVEDQLRNIPAHLHISYIKGQFANIKSLTVYPCFDRVESHEGVDISMIPRSEPIHVGMDFNIGNMASVVLAYHEGRPFIVDELTGVADTPTMITKLRERYQSRQIIVYPDASGKNRDATGRDTSHFLLRQGGFRVVVDPSNPAVGDRINSVNAMLKNSIGERRLKVNTSRCPVLTRCLERQSWKDGSPDKSNNIDHPLDALGYVVHKLHPLRRTPTIRAH